MYVSKVLQISETNGTLSVWTSVMLVPQGTVPMDFRLPGSCVIVDQPTHEIKHI